MKGDPELLAMSRVRRILVGLRVPQRERVLANLAEKMIVTDETERKLAAYWTARVKAREARGDCPEEEPAGQAVTG